MFAALGSPLVTEEYLLSPDGEQWHLRRSNISIPPTSNVFAPANLRAAAGNKVGGDEESVKSDFISVLLSFFLGLVPIDNSKPQ